MDIDFLYALTKVHDHNAPYCVLRHFDKVILCQKPLETFTSLTEIPDETFATGWQNFDGKTGNWMSWDSIEEIAVASKRKYENQNIHHPLTSDRATWKELLSKETFVQSIELMQNEMATGEYYLANLTRTIHLETRIDPFYVAATSCLYHDSPFRFFSKVRDTSFLGLSPERFLKIENNTAICEPMKGTAKSSDQLINNEKEFDENTMMIDLVRSDLSRICDPLSIAVEGRNIISKHPGLAQMSSRITGVLAFQNILEAIVEIMPVASVLGTPKKRVSKAIREYEPESRNEYCGTYGWIDTSKKECDLAVSIRSIVSNSHGVSIGIGAGITIDSNAQSEWDETVLKESRFKKLVATSIPFESSGIFTSTKIDRTKRIFAYKFHLDRLTAQAGLEGLDLDTDHIDELVQNALKNRSKSKAQYLKIIVDLNAKIKVELVDAPQNQIGSEERFSRNAETDLVQITKSNDRSFYNRALEFSRLLQNEFLDDAILLVGGLVTETTRANIFIDTNQGIVTPSISNPMLDGVARKALLNDLKENGIQVTEAPIRVDQLQNAKEIIVVNSVRGPQRIRKISSPLLDQNIVLDLSESSLYDLGKKSFDSQMLDFK